MSIPSSTENSHERSSENRTAEADLENTAGVQHDGTAENGDKEAATDTPPSPRKVHGLAVQTSSGSTENARPLTGFII